MTIDTLRLTPERIITAIKGTGTPVISPGGSTIAYSLSEVDPITMKNASQIWLVNSDGSQPRQVSSDGQTNSGQVWSADGSSLAWVSKRDGEKPFAIVIWETATGVEREIVRHANSPISLAWSPDGSTIAYSHLVDPENPTEEPIDPEAAPKVRAFRRLDYKQDNRGLLYDTRLQIFVVDVATGETRQLSQNALDHTDPQWSPDGSLLALKVHNRNGMHHQLGILNPETGTGRLVGTADWTLGTYRWSRDGSFILFDGYETHTPHSEYGRYDVASGTVTWLTTDLHFSPEVGYPTLGSPAQPVWLSDTTALVHGIHAGASGLWTVDAFSGEISEVARFEAVHTGLSIDDALTTVVQGRSTPLTTGEIVAIDLASHAETVIVAPNVDVLGETPTGSSEKITIERGGESIDSWLMFPPDFDPAGSYPVVLYVHGGPHGNYGYSFDKVASVLANAGYIVVMPNPRGSGTYGRHFAELVRGDWGYGDWADLEASLDEVLTRPYADADRTAIMGYSYGGYMTSWAIGHTNRFAAAVCGAPVFDLESFYGTSDIGHVWGVHQWGGELPDHREWLLEHSPSTHIHHATTPTLIVHGEQDHRCPIGQGEQLFVALSHLGVETEFVRYPGGAHLMFHSGPNEHKIDYYQRVIDWLGARV